jgi:uncharacterized protein
METLSAARSAARKPVIDAHTHLGPVSRFYAPESGLKDLLKRMDRLGIGHAVCADHISLFGGARNGRDAWARIHETSGGRLHFLVPYDPRNHEECFEIVKRSFSQPWFAGIKIHPSFHGVPADHGSYARVWELADRHGCAILSHSWSLSDFNPDQAHSVPSKFKGYVEKNPNARVVLAHAGGRGNGRDELVTLMGAYDNVYTDIAGDVFCRRLLETLLAHVPSSRVLYGSDFPWFDPAANLTRVLLADIGEEGISRILRDNAIEVYGIRD